MKKYYIMHMDEKIALATDEELLEIYVEFMLPPYLKEFKSVAKWLTTRAADKTRSSVRMVKRLLKMKEKNDIATALFVHGRVVTDNYWMKETESELTFEDVKFTDDFFAKVALNGDITDVEAEAYTHRLTQELTNIGSFDKAWVHIDGSFTLVKRGTLKELFSELFIYKLGEYLGLNMARYYIKDGCICSPDFTDGASWNLSHANAWVGDDEDYIYNYDIFRKISWKISEDYLLMLMLDALVLNGDRHTKNYGIATSIISGEPFRFAPLYDHNIALLCATRKDRRDTVDILITDLRDLVNARTIEIPTWDIRKGDVWDIFCECIDELACQQSDIDFDQVWSMIEFGHEYLNKIRRSEDF